MEITEVDIANNVIKFKRKIGEETKNSSYHDLFGSVVNNWIGHSISPNEI